MPTHSQQQLQTAIDQIRASQNQLASRHQSRGSHDHRNGPDLHNNIGRRARATVNAPGPGNTNHAQGNTKSTKDNNRISTKQIDDISTALADIGTRFARLEDTIGDQHNSAQALQDMAIQVEQLSSVVELLANSVGERSHIKRLETQISKLAEAVASGSDLDFYSIDERLGILTEAFDRLSQLHSEQLQTMERTDDAKHMQDMHLEAVQTGVQSISQRLDNMDMGAIEASVRTIYDRIDALEANMATPLPAIERLSRELADFSKALRNEKGPVVSSSLVNRVDTLNQRISQIEDSGQPVEALKIDMQELHEAVVKAMEPRFAALEDKIGTLSGQFASNDGNDGKSSNGLPDISVGDLEKQIRLLGEKMDHTSSELGGLQRLYSDQEATKPEQDIGAIADLVAKRATQAMEKVQEQHPATASLDAMEQLETRLSSLFDKSNMNSGQQGFSRVQDSIEQVNQRLERLEISLRNTDLSVADPKTTPETKTVPETKTTPETTSGPETANQDSVDQDSTDKDSANQDFANQAATEDPAKLSAAPLPPSPPVIAGLGKDNNASKAFENKLQDHEQPSPRHPAGEANDKMPKAPSDEAPLNSPPFPTPFFDNKRVPVPSPLQAEAENSQINKPGDVEFAQNAPEHVKSGEKFGTGRIKLPQFEREHSPLPPAPISSLANGDSNGDGDNDGANAVERSTPRQPAPEGRLQTSRENISRSTFIEAARRAAQKHNPEPTEKAELSLIGRALARFQKKQDGQKSDEQEPDDKEPEGQANSPAKPYFGVKLWRQKRQQTKPAQDALSKKEHLEELASNTGGFENPAMAKPMPDEFDIEDISVRDTSGEQSFLNKHRQVILLVASLLTISLLTINLIKQRSSETLPRASAISSDLGTKTPKANPSGNETAPTSEPAPPAAQSGGQTNPTPTAEQSGGQTEITTGDITGSIEGSSPQTGANIRIIDPTAIAQMPARLDLASISSGQTTAPPSTLKLPPKALGPLALRQAAARGDARAQFEVAAIYAEGRAVTQDLKEAALWYQRAAAKGFAPAAYRLGNMYENGVGVDKNLEQAAMWYKLGAQAGNRMAMHNLASLLASGSLGKQRFAEAAQWFEKAAALGLKDSQFNLGMLYARGLGVGQDMQTSFKWFSIAANQGDQDAAKAARDIASSLDPTLVARLQAELTNWAPANMNIKANFAPIGTWSDNFDPGPAIEKPDVILQVQAALNRIGFDAGKPDGLIGPKTAKAIDAFEKALGMSPSGTVNPRLLAVLGSQPV